MKTKRPPIALCATGRRPRNPRSGSAGCSTETYLPDPPPPMVPLDVQWLGNGVRVGWKSRAGHVCQLEHSDSPDEWAPSAGIPLRYGTGGWLEADDISITAPARGFTRLKIFRLSD